MLPWHLDVLLVFCCVHSHSDVCFLSDEELDNRTNAEQFVELDSLDTEKALLLTDDDDHLWVCNQILLHFLIFLNNQIIMFCKILILIPIVSFFIMEYAIILHCMLRIKL